MYVSTLDGEVSGARLLGELYLNAPEECQGRTCWLVDLREATIEMSTNDVKKLASHLLGYRVRSACSDDHCMVATVVNDDVSFGMLRMLHAYLGEVIDLHVTRCYDDAVEWLNTYCDTEEGEGDSPDKLKRCA